MMASLDFQFEGSPFTILLVRQPLVSTLWFMLAVWPRSILLLHWTKFVSSAVESLQVGKTPIPIVLKRIKIFPHSFDEDLVSCCRSRSHIECCKAEERLHGGHFWTGSCRACSKFRIQYTIQMISLSILGVLMLACYLCEICFCCLS